VSKYEQPTLKIQSGLSEELPYPLLTVMNMSFNVNDKSNDSVCDSASTTPVLCTIHRNNLAVLSGIKECMHMLSEPPLSSDESLIVHA